MFGSLLFVLKPRRGSNHSLFTMSVAEILAMTAEQCEIVGEQMHKTCEGLIGMVAGLQEITVETAFAREQKENFQALAKLANGSNVSCVVCHVFTTGARAHKLLSCALFHCACANKR